MTRRLSKTLIAASAIAALAVPVAAQASQGADDPVGHDAAPAVVSVAPSAPAAAKKAEKVHRHRHGRKGPRRSDDRGASRARGDNQARRGADDGPNHR